MSGPFIERLSRFTPDAGGLDRDALLFAAGRACARPNRGWIAVAAALAAGWAVTVVLLWPHPAAPNPRLPAPPSVPGPAAPEPSENPGLWSARRSLLESDPEKPPAPPSAAPMIDTGPPLRAFAAPPPSILN